MPGGPVPAGRKNFLVIPLPIESGWNETSVTSAYAYNGYYGSGLTPEL
jgi:hypothetical protein